MRPDVVGRADARGGLRGWLVPADRPARRFAQLLAGLAVQGLGTALMVHAALGNMPWDVLHEGLAAATGVLSLGGWMMVLGVLVLLAWIPLRERPGVGTVVNALTAGIWADLFLTLVSGTDGLWVRAAMGAAGILAHALGTAVYLGAGLGSGPRDGLMTGIVGRTGAPVELVRTLIEVFVVLCGWVFGGTLGAITVVYALCAGPIMHLALPYTRVTRA